MRKFIFILPLLLPTATAPAMADTPVAPSQLDGFVGGSLKGHALANLGYVGAADARSGMVAVVSRYGQIAMVHTSMLSKKGMMLKAPALSGGDIARVSSLGRSREPFTAGTIIIEELAP
jgi:hypothetical protein